MTKNKSQSPLFNGDILDSDQNTTQSPESINLENEQENTPIEDAILDNSNSQNLTTTSKNASNTSSTNTTSTQKYKVVLTTDTKFVLDVNGFGQSYSHNTYTKSLNFTQGDFIEIPPEKGE